MTRGDAAGGDHRFNRFGQSQQSQRVGDRWTRFAQALRDLLLRKIVRFDQLRHAGRFFERVEILALQILDDRNFETFEIAGRTNDCRNGRTLHRRACTPPALACNQFVAVAAFADQDRHEDTVLANRGLQLLEGCRIKILARLMRIGTNAIDRNLPDDFTGGHRRADRSSRHRRIAKQRAQAAPESTFRRGAHLKWAPVSPGAHAHNCLPKISPWARPGNSVTAQAPFVVVTGALARRASLLQATCTLVRRATLDRKESPVYRTTALRKGGYCAESAFETFAAENTR